jgi:hypothetical protein
MAEGHDFSVVIVAEGQVDGADPAQTPDKAIQYTGEKIKVRLESVDSGQL